MKKINIFINKTYYCSTNSFKTCKEAKQSVIDKLQTKSKYLPDYVETLEWLKVTANFETSIKK